MSWAEELQGDHYAVVSFTKIQVYFNMLFINQDFTVNSVFKCVFQVH